MIDLYAARTGNAFRAAIALEESGLAYRVIPVDLRAPREAAYLKLNPTGRIPTIVDHDARSEPLVLTQSTAIILYVARKSGRLLPRSDRGKFVALEWLMFQMASVGPMMGQSGHFRSNAAPERIEYAIQRYGNEVKRLHGVMERRLGESRFLGADEYTIADIAVWPWLRASERSGIVWTDFPRVKAWFDRIADRPAVKRGIQVLAEHNTAPGQYDDKARAVLFGARQYERR